MLGGLFVVFCLFLLISALYSEMQVVSAIEGINNSVIFFDSGLKYIFNSYSISVHGISHLMIDYCWNMMTDGITTCCKISRGLAECMVSVEELQNL